MADAESTPIMIELTADPLENIELLVDLGSAKIRARDATNFPVLNPSLLDP